MEKYGLKLLYRYEVPEAQEVFYEMSIVAVQAENEDEAYEKAYAYAGKYIDYNHINYKGQRVIESLVDVLDCYVIYDDEEVHEVYSCFLKNRTRMNEQDFLDIFSDKCTGEELVPLRYFKG